MIPDLQRPGGDGGGWTEVVDSTVSGGAVTTIALGSGFDLDTYDYDIEFSLENPTVGSINFYLYCNNNTTNADYNSNAFYSKGSSGTGTANSLGYFNGPGVAVSTAGFEVVGEVNLRQSPGGQAFAWCHSIRQKSATAVTAWDWVWFWETVTNVTRLDLTGDTASSIANGSRVRVYGRAK